MKAVIIFTGSGPLLILTTYQSPEDPNFLIKLASKGIKKLIAYELPVDLVKEKYGTHYQVIMNDVKQADDLRVLDYNGHNVFYNFAFRDMGTSIFHDPE